MIELTQRTGPDTTSPIVINTDNVLSFEPGGAGLTSLTLRNGRALVVVGSYERVRDAVLRVRSAFETLVQA